MFVYISFGNSDNKLTQQQWSDFCSEIDDLMYHFSAVLEVMNLHGKWYSLPNSEYQNACIAFEFSDDRYVSLMKEKLTLIAAVFNQDSIAWVQSTTTEMLKPNE